MPSLNTESKTFMTQVLSEDESFKSLTKRIGKIIDDVCGQEDTPDRMFSMFT